MGLQHNDVLFTNLRFTIYAPFDYRIIYRVGDDTETLKL